ncbi:hypothetical protein ACHAWF_000632, partial [Thalassiosira exigua]
PATHCQPADNLLTIAVSDLSTLRWIQLGTGIGSERRASDVCRSPLAPGEQRRWRRGSGRADRVRSLRRRPREPERGEGERRGNEATWAPIPERPRGEGAGSEVDNVERGGGGECTAKARTGAVALPSVQISAAEEKKIAREQYGGKGDKPCLGGFTKFAVRTAYRLWVRDEYACKHRLIVGIQPLLHRSLAAAESFPHALEAYDNLRRVRQGHIDVVVRPAGFRLRALRRRKPRCGVVIDRAQCERARGRVLPWWPDRTVDVARAVEFTQHVGRNYQPNYLTAFRKPALVFVTHSDWGEWHHVEVHDNDCWRVRWEAVGFV